MQSVFCFLLRPVGRRDFSARPEPKKTTGHEQKGATTQKKTPWPHRTLRGHHWHSRRLVRGFADPFRCADDEDVLSSAPLETVIQYINSLDRDREATWTEALAERDQKENRELSMSMKTEKGLYMLQRADGINTQELARLKTLARKFLQRSSALIQGFMQIP